MLWESHAVAIHHYSKFFIAGGIVLAGATAVMGLLSGHLPISPSCLGCEPPPDYVYLAPMNDFFSWFAYPGIWMGLGIAIVSVTAWNSSKNLIHNG